MSRYYSDLDDAYYTSHQQSDSVRASGWQSPLPTTNTIPSSSVIRIVVECPFGSKKCDYTIDKSQRGRLIVTARRRHTFTSDYFSLNNKNNIAIQTFTIPYDADVDHLQSHIERYTRRLIIEIPRLSDIFTSTISPSQLKYDDTKYSRRYLDNNRKLEYYIDCHGYKADELDVFIQDQDLIVQGKTKPVTSSDPTQQHIFKKFSRKISLPNTVDLSKVVSYFENGKLRIEAPLKRGIYYSDDEIFSPELTSTVVSNGPAVEFNRIQSPIPGNRQRHYRRREHVSRDRAYDHDDDRRPISPRRRVRSTEGLRYPFYRSPRDLDEDDDDVREGRHRRTVNYERYITNRNDTEQEPIYRSVYSPTNNVVTTRTLYHDYPMDKDIYFKH